jgi:hypothetical protein
MKNAVFWNGTLCGSCTNDVSEELSASIISVARIGELGTMLAQLATGARFVAILVTLMMEVPSSSEKSFLQEPHSVKSQKTPFFRSNFIYKKFLRLFS